MKSFFFFLVICSVDLMLVAMTGEWNPKISKVIWVLQPQYSGWVVLISALLLAVSCMGLYRASKK